MGEALDETGPVTAAEVAAKLGVSVSTLNSWLASDGARMPADRRFDFHRYRGRKRVWSAEDYERLETAIERESAPGGVLGGWRNRSSVSAAATPRAEAALREVLNYRVGGGSRDGDRDRIAHRPIRSCP